MGDSEVVGTVGVGAGFLVVVGTFNEVVGAELSGLVVVDGSVVIVTVSGVVLLVEFGFVEAV